MIGFELLFQVTGFTSGRTAALLPAILGLISLIGGSLTLARSSGQLRYGKLSVTVVLVAGALAILLSGIHLTRSINESIGTGSGRLGATVALVLGLIGIVFGGITLRRLRKKASG